jgi:glycosyltransferase involved in cell wall biosynthesis
MGELARLVVAATAFAGIPHTTVVNNRHLSRSAASFTSTKSEERYPIDIVVINADQIQQWSDESISAGEPRRLRVGVWAWEVEEFPATFDRAFDYVDEVWAISQFTQAAIQRRTKKPVFTVPLPQQARTPDAFRPLDLGSLDLPTKPYFLVMFDFLSVIDRKNPFAAIDAFTRAFSPDEDVQLIIKTINGDRCVIDRERLRYAARNDERIHIIEDYLTADEVRELMRGSLAYVSLHRSEGYGLTCSEAMGLGVPVIATGYSGNVDFMNNDNSLLVPYELVAVDSSVGVYPPTTVWADADVAVAAQYMRRIADQPEFAAEVGKAGFLSIRDSDTLGQAALFVATRVNYLMKHQDALQRRATRAANPLRKAARGLPAPVKKTLKRLARSLR